MGRVGSGAVIERVGALFGEGTTAGLTDDQLLGRFTDGRGRVAEGAFTALVARHGPMVRGVCGRVLRDEHDAEDAFQAVFLVLARRAGSLRNPGRLAPWLHGVALRTAKEARRRRHTVPQVGGKDGDGPVSVADGPDRAAERREEAEALHEEVDRLPEHERGAVVLCHFQGLTQEEAARHLGAPIGTIGARLTRARERLRSRLTRRGLAPAVAMLGAATIPPRRAEAAVPPSLEAATLRAVFSINQHRAATAGEVSATAASLAEGVLRTMTLTRLKTAALTFAGVAGAIALTSVLALAARVGTSPGATADNPKPSPSAKPNQVTTPITVFGRAVDDAGNPVPGATIFLVSTNGIDAPLGTAKTDAGGRYAFPEVALPVRREREGADLAGAFQVYGTAPGLGFAWHGMRHYLVGPRPDVVPERDADFQRYAGDELIFDLTFRSAVAYQGRVEDESGRPISGARVELHSADYLDMDGRESHKNYREFWSMSRLPKERRTAVSGDDGRFRVEGLPDGTYYWASISHAGHADRHFFASTAVGVAPLKVFEKVEEIGGNDATILLAAPRKVSARIVLADTGQPAARMRVNASTNQATGDSASGTTDAEGKVVLGLPSGDYDLVVDPPRGSEYIRTKARLAVGDAPEQEAAVEVHRGCVVNLRAVDADTGEGIRDVSFFVTFDQDGRGTTTSLSSSPGVSDDSRTDSDGRLRVVSEPGRRTFSVGQIGKGQGYRPDAEARSADLVPGEPVTLEFELHKVNP